MRHIFAITLLFCFTDTQAYTVNEIKKEYEIIFTARVKHYEGETYVRTDINKLPNDHFLADFVNNNNLYIDYILINYSTIDWKKLKSLQADTVELNNFFVNSLRTDSVFNKHFIEATYYFLTSKGCSITDYHPQEKLEISPDSLVSTATRFFYATHFDDKGRTKWYVCVGKNGYRYNKKENMVPLIEAFCFMTVMTNLRSKEYDFYSDYKNYISKLEKEKTDKEGEEKLDYIRKRMYALMGQSNILGKLLLDEYVRKKDILSFELTKK